MTKESEATVSVENSLFIQNEMWGFRQRTKLYDSAH